ncbi:methionine biosynthesis PLP-dependent protein [Terrilactibacillus sp. BCM23-1]|uniref:Methionine biosynthesis PLP-dependent protein n=1 Tax=Terrilactibacillus tamarindi TaxID=2599694 RepID=A0A6N8CVC0_9BACI|nr:methionine biosynthesis PLP-dependent protein [Terrilactibacillus tamarindi]MTT33223.1 methionine biosynthesis PLP-dependent protein [Terrilactibacillus tamarindi]
MSSFKSETKFAQIGNRFDVLGAVNTPIYFSSAYRHTELGHGKGSGYDYIRTGNPTRSVLERAIADIEHGDRGFACSSGMSAIQLVLSLFSSGDHIISSRDLYGGTYRIFEFLSDKYSVSFDYWDGEELDDLESLIRSSTKAIFIETPTNPLMKETDIEKVSALAKKYHLLVIVDNTFYTPFLQKPIDQGADIVIHSATKYLGGHNDLLAGLVVSKGEEISEKLDLYHNASGVVLSPFDSWLLIRGMKTLPLRMRQHEANAKCIFSYLSDHPQVKNVFYPGKGGMLSFELEKESLVTPFLQALKLITFAESLGGVESLITYPATQTHADIPQELRERYGLSNCLLRLSVGIEHEDDLVNDLEQAFKTINKDVFVHD